MKTYNVYDSYGVLVRGGFNSYKAAYTFLIANNRYDWYIQQN